MASIWKGVPWPEHLKASFLNGGANCTRLLKKHTPIPRWLGLQEPSTKIEKPVKLLARE